MFDPFFEVKLFENMVKDFLTSDFDLKIELVDKMLLNIFMFMSQKPS